MEPSPSSRIFIKNLPSNLTPDNFRTHFSHKLPLTDARFIPHRRIGYVGYRTPEDAAKAIKYFHKSFMGMARLNVESAKPVEEMVGRCKRRNLDGNGIERERDHVKDSSESKQDLETSKGKRKWELGSDWKESKLQEYLQVMRAPSKSNTWQNQDQNTLANEVMPEVMYKDPAFQGTNSEDEYEPILKKKKKRKTERQLEADRAKLPSPPDTPAEKNYGSQDPRSEAAGSNGKLEDASKATSDADWLRSRTSRLLGLVDEDDALEAGAEENEKPLMSAAETSQISSQGKLQDTAAGDQLEEDIEDADTLATKTAAEETHTLTSGRLFVRNLTYTATEEDLQAHFEDHGYRGLEEVGLSQPTY